MIKSTNMSFRCSPSPGSYPVQAYAPAPMFAFQTTGNSPSSLDGWTHSTIIQQNYTVPSLNPNHSIGPGFGSSHGHAYGHNCGHSHQYQTNNFWMSKAYSAYSEYAYSHFSSSKSMAVQSFDNPSHTTAKSNSVAAVHVLSN